MSSDEEAWEMSDSGSAAENESDEEEAGGSDEGEEEEDEGEVTRESDDGEAEEDQDETIESDGGDEEEEEEDDDDETRDDDGGDDAEENTGGSDGGEQEELSGWADSMLKILKSTKPKNKKNLMLSRARKDYEVNRNADKKPKKGNDIEIAKDEKSHKDDDGDDVKVKAEPEDSDIISAKQQRKLELRQKKLEKAWENLNRLTTENPDREMEINLLKVATKGVVQLFNAVAQQQKTIKTKLRGSSKSEFKKDKVLSQSKDIFNKAMTKNRIVGKDSADESDDEDNPVEIKEESSSDDDGGYTKESRKRKTKRTNSESSSKKPMWQALQDDFMLDAKLKDWDKNSDSD